MKAFKNISLGRNLKKYTHDMSFDNNTTMPFGVVQPLMSQFMMSNSDIDVNYRQLVRLAPLYSPTFGRMHIQNEFVFVPSVEVCPFYECVASHFPYSSGSTSWYPSSVFTIDNQMLTYILLSRYASYCVYVDSQEDDATYGGVDYVLATDSTFHTQSAQQSYLLAAMGYDSSSLSLPTEFDFSGNLNNDITFESADYIINVTYDGNEVAVLYRLTAAGRRLRTNLKGLGYSIDISDGDTLSFLPILAYYKAYFDLYEPKRVQQWTDTDAYRLISLMTDNQYVNLYIDSFDQGNRDTDVNSTMATYLLLILDKLANTWYSDSVDFMSANTSKPMPNNGNASKSYSIGASNGTGTVLYSTTSTPFPAVSSVNSVILQGIMRVSRMVAKDSIIGGKLYDWLKVHYGADVANSMFKVSSHIGSSRMDVQVDDIFSTADTASSSGSGEYLGSYAGKGIGFNKNSFKYHTDVDGFIFVLSSLVPDARYFQGNDNWLYCINRSTIPLPEYDALGYELTPMTSVCDNNSISYGSESSQTGNSFGYVPRYSSLKRRKDVINGDMSRRGSIDSYSPYYLDKILNKNICIVNGINYADDDESVKSYAVDFTGGSIPTASDIWRFPCRYAFLGAYDRIFYNQNTGSIYKGSGLNYNSTSSDSSQDIINPVDDNFVCQTVFDVKMRNVLLPISMSYDTYDEKDVDSIDVKQF